MHICIDHNIHKQICKSSTAVKSEIFVLRLFDFLSKQIELGQRQSSIIVVIEPLDEVQSPVLWVFQLGLQDAYRLLETDVLFSSEPHDDDNNNDKPQ